MDYVKLVGKYTPKPPTAPMLHAFVRTLAGNDPSLRQALKMSLIVKFSAYRLMSNILVHISQGLHYSHMRNGITPFIIYLLFIMSKFLCNKT